MNDEITGYVETVRGSLAGIAAPTREELLEDLPEHLAEVLAEGNGTLVDRLGSPQAYAAELRATAGLVGDFPDPPAPRFPVFFEARDTVLRVLDKADVRVGPVIGYPKASDFLVMLRPGWWVLRGYLAAMAIAYLLGANHGNTGLLPRIGDNELVALVLLAGCVVVSIVLARHTANLARLPRYALRAGTAFLIIFAFSGFLGADQDSRNINYNDANYDYYGGNPYSNVNDVYVYDSKGNLVTGARLYDQEGNAIQLGSLYCSETEDEFGTPERSRNLGYPHCPQNAPYANSDGRDPYVIPSRSASPSASFVDPSPSESPSAKPTVPAR